MTASGPESGLAILFIGGVFPRGEEASVLAKTRGAVQFAANALQWNLIGGLDAALLSRVTLLNAPFVGSYPRLYRDVWIRGGRWSHTPGAKDEAIGFLNLFGVKQIWRTWSLTRKARRWAALPRQGPRAIVIYSMHTPFLVAAAMAKNVDPTLTVCLIVPDLPEHMNLGETTPRLLALMKVLDRRVMNRFMAQVDCFALLTRHMAEPLGVGRRPWIIMEGAVNPDDLPAAHESEVGALQKVILYAGTLTKAYGVLQLLEAFALLSDPDYRLWICGAGEGEDEVREASRQDGRIRFFGQLTRAEVLALQRQATVLVNPRSDAGIFTRYSFPSKILEYMLSGTPTIARKLPGMPDEYLDHIFVVDGPTAADLSRTLALVCGMPAHARKSFGEAAQRFVIDQKNARAQAQRIVRLIVDTSG